KQKDYEIESDYVESSGGQAFTILITVFLFLAVGIAALLITDTNPFSWFSSSAELADAMPEEEEGPKISDVELFDPSGEVVSGDEVEEAADPPQESESTEEVINDPPPREPNPPVQNTNTTVISNSSFVASFSYNPRPPANLNEILINSKTSRYYLVLGSFDNKENAYSFYNNLNARGINSSRIISPSADNPRYRVTYQGYSSQAEARNNAASVQQRYQVNVWVLAY
ncbi:MAG: SPOR domain-containing protein, partial [Bacteroidota bacterium]